MELNYYETKSSSFKKYKDVKKRSKNLSYEPSIYIVGN